MYIYTHTYIYIYIYIHVYIYIYLARTITRIIPVITPQTSSGARKPSGHHFRTFPHKKRELLRKPTEHQQYTPEEAVNKLPQPKNPGTENQRSINNTLPRKLSTNYPNALSSHL